MTDAEAKPTVELTIRVTEEQLDWAVRHINDWIASQPAPPVRPTRRRSTALPSQRVLHA